MNKKGLISLSIFGATTVLSFVTLHVMSLFDISKWVGVSVGLALFAIMFIVLMLIITKAPEKYEQPTQLAALAVNALADGLAMSSLFTYIGRFPKVWQSAAAAAILITVYALYLLLTYIPFVRRHYIICMAFYVLAIVGGGIAFCATASRSVKAISALILLYLVIFIAFFIPLANSARNARQHIEKLAYCSFAGLIVALIVLVIISESDADFFPDAMGSDVGSIGTGKKRNPYDFSSQ